VCLLDISLLLFSKNIFSFNVFLFCDNIFKFWKSNSSNLPKELKIIFEQFNYPKKRTKTSVTEELGTNFVNSSHSVYKKKARKKKNRKFLKYRKLNIINILKAKLSIIKNQNAVSSSVLRPGRPWELIITPTEPPA
jgi:hypothetical protein